MILCYLHIIIRDICYMSKPEANGENQGNTTMAYIVGDIIELAGIACFVTFITFLAMAF